MVSADARYDCPHCGEEIVVPVDPLAGDRQDYVEDCPVCCSPNLLHVDVFEDAAEPGAGDAACSVAQSVYEVRVWAEPESE